MRIVICTFTNMNTNACDQKKLMLKICLSYLQLLIVSISLFPWRVFLTVKNVSFSGFSVAINAIFVHMDTHLPHLVGIKMCLSINDMCGGEYNIQRRVNLVLGLICSISVYLRIFKLAYYNQQMHKYEICFIRSYWLLTCIYHFCHHHQGSIKRVAENCVGWNTQCSRHLL